MNGKAYVMSNFVIANIQATPAKNVENIAEIIQGLKKINAKLFRS